MNTAQHQSESSNDAKQLLNKLVKNFLLNQPSSVRKEGDIISKNSSSQYMINNSTNVKPLDALQLVNIFYSKGYKKQAQKILQKVKSHGSQSQISAQQLFDDEQTNSVIQSEKKVPFVQEILQIESTKLKKKISASKFNEMISNFEQCIEQNMQFYQAYYKIAETYRKNLNNDQMATKWYKKTLQINPKHIDAYYNLGLIYQKNSQLQQAIQYYQQVVSLYSESTPTLVNLGICYLKLNKFTEAGKYLRMAAKAYPLDIYDWYQQMCIEKLLKRIGEKLKWFNNSQKYQLQDIEELLKQHDTNFKLIKNSQKDIIPIEKIMNASIIKIINLLYEYKFKLSEMPSTIFDLIYDLSLHSIDYFHILAIIIAENYAMYSTENISQIENKTRQMLEALNNRLGKDQIENTLKSQGNSNNKTKLDFDKVETKKINLFQRRVYFNSYNQLEKEIHFVNKAQRKYEIRFSEFVSQIRKQTHGRPGGVGAKIQAVICQKHRSILRITEKMFKQELKNEKSQQLIQEIHSLVNNSDLNFSSVVDQVYKAWKKRLGDILEERKQKQTVTHCQISDLLRAKIKYTNIEELLQGIETVKTVCQNNKYQILEMENRLDKPETQDVMFKVLISSSAVCELQLALIQDEKYTLLAHSIYEITRSTLGCIFGSYLFLMKPVKYSFINNCQDIISHLAQQRELNKEEAQLKETTEYVMQKLTKYIMADKQSQDEGFNTQLIRYIIKMVVNKDESRNDEQKSQ